MRRHLEVDIVAVDLPTMGHYFDSSGALIHGAGPKLAAALGVGAAVDRCAGHHGLGQRGIVLARVDRARCRIHLVAPREVPLTGNAAVPLGLVPRPDGATRRGGVEALDPGDLCEECPLVRFEDAVIHDAVTPRRGGN